MVSLCLVVEDDKDLAKIARQVLNQEGHRVVVANHTPGAFKIIFELERQGLTPSTVITDLNLLPYEELDGLKFKRIFSNRYSDVEVILATGNSDDERVKQFKRSGGNVMNKPYDFDELCNQVVRSEELFRMRREVPLG